MPRRRTHETGLTAEVNVTSLVDVAFTLLVIFIITAPILQGGVDVQVPRARAETISAPDGVVVSVTRAGALYIGDAEVPMAQFESALTDAVREQQTRNVYLRADEGVSYGQVLEVLAQMKSLDIANVGLVAEPLSGAGRGGA